MLVKACLNGARSPSEHPALPVTPGELAAEAGAAVAAGAGALHLHPRDAEGAETLAAAAVAAALRAIRSACPGVPVGVSTGLWITDGDPERRLAEIAGWAGGERPDFASVNLSEEGAGELAAALRDVGVGVEAGTWSEENAELVAAGALRGDLVRILIEPQEDDAGAAVARAAAIERELSDRGVPGPRLHHGYGAATWAVLAAAVARGRDIRAGLEDTLELPGGGTASGNGELVAAAVRLAQEAP
ncbi:MAG: 3-keto-5-aminohexanoate cleavage protein [Thermoleophilaceae bacterium]|nr:3-keto-5-aminohexanoate cleavage protein [Thermoleophilaceae bacterium]